MAYAYSVEHVSYGETKVALFLDRTRAEDYAGRFHGVVFELGKVCLSGTGDNSRMSQLLCTTEKEPYSQPAATAMSRPIQ